MKKKFSFFLFISFPLFWREIPSIVKPSKNRLNTVRTIVARWIMRNEIKSFEEEKLNENKESEY